MIKWKHFPCYWPFVWGIQWSLVNSPRKGRWHGALMFSLFGAWINGWVNNWDAGDLRRCCAHFDITVMDLRHLRIKNWLNIYIYLYLCKRNSAWWGWRKAFFFFILLPVLSDILQVSLTDISHGMYLLLMPLLHNNSLFPSAGSRVF